MPPPEWLSAAASRLHYSEVLPSKALAPWIACYWSLSGHLTEPVPTRVLPDLCADIIVDVAASPDPFVVGTMRRALVVRHFGQVDLFGVRFRPGAALRFLGAPLSELTDRRIGLDALWGPMAESLADAICSVPLAARVSAVERALSSWVEAPRAEMELATRAVALFRRTRGSIGVGAAAAALGVGERRLERAFAQCVGLRPKEIVRVLRFRTAIHLIDSASTISWSDLAFAAGYADQSHLIREFKAFAGVTPASYVREPGRVGFVQYSGVEN